MAAVGHGQKIEGGFEDDAEQALVADEEAGVIGANSIAGGTAPFDDVARGQNRFEAEHMVRGHAVFEAMGAAGVEADISADGADGLAGRIRRKEKAVGGCRFGHIGIYDAGLDHGDALSWVDAQNAIELGGHDHNAGFDGGRACTQAGATAAHDKWHAFAAAPAHDSDDLLGGLRQNRGSCSAAVGRLRIGVVGGTIRFAGENAIGRYNLAEGGSEWSHRLRTEESRWRIEV